MIQLFSLIAITSLLILGYIISTQEGMIFYGIREWAIRKSDNGAWWAKPIFLCHYCQPSSWSLIAYFISYVTGIAGPMSMKSLILYPLCVCGASITVGVIWSLHEAISSIRDYFTIVTQNEVDGVEEDDDDMDVYNDFWNIRKTSEQ